MVASHLPVAVTTRVTPDPDAVKAEEARYLSMATGMTSRERLLAAMEHRPVDRVPLCFEGVCHGSVVPIDRQHPDPVERARHYQSLGVDHAVSVSPPMVSASGCQTRQWEQSFDDSRPVLVKEYATPAGSLRQVVRPSADYPHARVPLFSDHHVPPTRSLQYLVGGEQDLPALEYVLRPPRAEDLATFRAQARTAREFCDRAGLLLAGAAPGVGDPLMWLSGIEPVLLAAMDEPAFLEAYVTLVARWNLRIVEILLEAGVDVVVRRGWYESTDLWSPSLYRRFLLAPLQDEVRLAHQAGAKLSYVMNTGAMPLLPALVETGIDVLSNIDPQAPGTSLVAMKRQVGERLCLCGGVNNTHVLEQGTEADVERAVRQAIEALAPGSGFILAPGDSVGYVEGTDADLVLRNVEAMVVAWRRACADLRH